MMFNDDEQIVAAQDVSGTNTKQQGTVGMIKLTDNHKPEAPLVQTDFKVMLKLMGVGPGNQRSGVDLVTVLDISGSMGGEKLLKMKVATQFLIKKLSPIDRLSVVTFTNVSSRRCPLRQMTEDFKDEIGSLVDSLDAGGGTNIAGGLEMGLQVIRDRQFTSGRVFAIMLMSDGGQTTGDAAQVNPGNVPVYTYGFGIDQDPKLMKSVADNSVGGVFADVQNSDNLSYAFSQSLAGLLTTDVQDLKLTVTKLHSNTIKKVTAGSYPQSKDESTDSITVSFGDLYNYEVRKVMLDIHLSAVQSPSGTEVVEVSYKYSTNGKLVEVPPVQVYIKRVGNPSPIEDAEVMMEENRLQTARMMKDARVMADDKNLDDALNKIDDAQNFLNEFSSSSNPLIQMLELELQLFKDYMETLDTYKKKGRPFALSSETSHDRQRLAVRGDDVDNLRLFSTPRMDAYLEQAKLFTEDPNIQLPTADQDVEEEIKKNPLASVVGPLSFYLDAAIQALRSIQAIIDNGTLV